MKPHHLDNIIDKLKKYLSGDEVDLSLVDMLLRAFEEIKTLDHRIDLIHDELDKENGYDT
jgi:hypothetical protein